ncbi:MAG TPA: DEAD/DEAH box helicase, partial [Rhodanobacteraceae bacterium]|nr:DEAD/DEAH box helicase [Rhodanobacteraceae bacterium]
MNAIAPIEQVPTAVGAGALAERVQAKYADRITGTLTIPASAGNLVSLPGDLPDELALALRSSDIQQLYSHQAEAWRAAARGENLVVITPTASGKSLCYTLPVVASVMRELAKALYLFPTKALAQDQVADLIELSKAGSLGIRAATFDGDTPGDQRQAIRLNGDIVISNPDMLHQGILPHHTKWAQFFESLKFIVIDEIHSYRGVFGSHLANVIRRLKRICAFYGTKPQFILCSATIGNPKEHAEALLGEPVTAITRSGAPSGEKRVLLWNPPVVNPDLGLRASARSQSNRIARLAIRSGLKTLVFAKS